MTSREDREFFVAANLSGVDGRIVATSTAVPTTVGVERFARYAGVSALRRRHPPRMTIAAPVGRPRWGRSMGSARVWPPSSVRRLRALPRPPNDADPAVPGVNLVILW